MRVLSDLSVLFWHDPTREGLSSLLPGWLGILRWPLVEILEHGMQWFLSPASLAISWRSGCSIMLGVLKIGGSNGPSNVGFGGGDPDVTTLRGLDLRFRYVALMDGALTMTFSSIVSLTVFVRASIPLLSCPPDLDAFGLVGPPQSNGRSSESLSSNEPASEMALDFA